MSFHSANDYLDGFLELEEELAALLSKVEKTEDVLVKGADAFVKDLLKLPKPYSQIKKSGYTHMINTFTWRMSTHKKGEVEVGWGKYYGRMVEEGTVKSKRQPHLKPTYNKNKNKYHKIMIRELGLD